ncbi:MAG: tetratricopeptide repeat protein [Pirellula sp.]
MKLLNYASVNESFMENPPHLSDLAEHVGPVYESIGDVIGPYKLLQRIGEGGMGAVFMADQLEPVQRRVAIKVIKPGMDTAQVLSRFETERQTIVMMDHPNIARALDVGTTDQGRPYFVMELVKGIPITHYCDAQRLSTNQRLSLFIPVCSAIQHAHLKGVIHRDLKPSNVLVAQYDNQAIPKVIDFGVAKAINQHWVQGTIFTQLGQVVGTLEYMSPEQSKLNQLDVDTRSDVYSLGVLLYELLTGSTPLQSNRLREVAWDELTKMIRDEEPPLPSVRISKSETIADIAACRQTEPGRLSRLVRGELDWIVMKALDKDRARRYQTPNDLALDIQRYLNNEAVMACPPSTLYQWGKFARRHSFWILSGALILGSLMLGFAGTLWQAYEAKKATSVAEQQRDLAEAESKRARLAEQAASVAADQSKREAEISRAIGNFVNEDLLAFADPNVEPDRNIQLRVLLDRAAQSVNKLQHVPPVEAALCHTLATAYLNLGEYRDSKKHADRALELRQKSYGTSNPETLESHLLVAEIQLHSAQFRDASKTYQEAIDLCSTTLGPRHTMTLRGLRGIGNTWLQLGRLDIARDHLRGLLETQRQVFGDNHREPLETRRELAELLHAKGLYHDAQIAFSALLPDLEAHFGAEHPMTLKAKGGAATTLLTLGRLGESRTARRAIFETQSRTLGPEHPETLMTASLLANVSFKAGKLNEAETQQRQLLQTAEDRLGDKHLVTIQLSTALADILAETGSLTEAKQIYGKAQDTIAAMLDYNNPLSLRIKFRFAGLAAFAGQYDEALSGFEEVLDSQRLLLGSLHVDTLQSQSAVVEIQMNRRKYDEAQALLAELIQNAVQSLGNAHPLTLQSKSKLFTLMSVRGNQTDAVPEYKELIAFCDREHGKETTIAIELAVGLAEALGRWGFTNDSVQLLESRLPDSIQLLGTEHPTTLRIQDSLAMNQRLIGRLTEARKRNEEAMEIRKRTLGETHPLTLRSINNVGTCLVDVGDPREGSKMFRIAYNASNANYGPNFPATLEYAQNLASTLGVLKEGAESLQLFQRILKAQKQTLGETHPDFLFTQVGMAGAYAHQQRIVEAERLYLSTLGEQKRVLGESHPHTLQCLERLIIVTGQQNRYTEAIQLCNEHLAISVGRFPGSPSAHRVMHACIEYHLVQGLTLQAKPFFDQSQDWIDRFGLSPDWMIKDLPMLFQAQVDAGQLDAAEASLRQHTKNCTSRFGTSHPVTLQAEIQLAKFLKTLNKNDDALRLFREASQKLDTLTNEPNRSDSRLVLVQAKLSGKYEDLAALATQAAEQESWLKSVILFSLCASIAADSDESAASDSEEFVSKAMEALDQVCRKGLVTQYRELATLTSSADFTLLRQRPLFSELAAKMERKLDTDFLTKLGWSYAMAGDYVMAKSTAGKLLAKNVDTPQAIQDHFNCACIFSRCYEGLQKEASRQNDAMISKSADEYLKLAIENIDCCFRDGYFATADGMDKLLQDEDLAAVRSTDAFQAFHRRLQQAQ